jgi:hypothetical protein
MSDKKDTLDLLAPVPTSDGECRRRVLHDPEHEDWVEVRVVLDGGPTGKRVVTALFDADDRPGTVSDVVTIPGGQRQLAVSGQVAAGGLIQGTYMGTDSSRALTETEVQRLRAVFASLRQRYP